MADTTDPEPTPSKETEGAALEACTTDNLPTLQTIMDSYSSQKLGLSALALASAKSSSPSTLSHLLNSGASFSQSLVTAALTCRVLSPLRSPTAFLPILLTHGFDPNTRFGGYLGNPLILAVRHSDLELFRALLDAGADPKSGARWGGGYGLLASAARKGSLETVKCVVEEAGARVRGSGALQAASLMGRLDVVRYLVQEMGEQSAERGEEGDAGGGVDDVPVRNMNWKGRTALSVAVENGWVQVAEVLLENGASVDAKGEDGKTVWDVAVEREEAADGKEVLKMLKRWDTKI